EESSWWKGRDGASSPGSPRPTRRRCGQGIVRPGMLRVAAPQLAAHFGVRRPPEAREIVGHLYRPAVRSEDLDRQRHPPARGPGRRSQTEQLLDARADGGRAVGGILDPCRAAAREAQYRRRLALEERPLRVGEQSAQGRRQIVSTERGEARALLC